MTSSNFSKSMLPRINEILKMAMESDNDFYRKKYEKISKPYPINSLADLKNLPRLEKDEILSLETSKRNFFPNSEIKGYNFSSGTTTNKKVSIFPQNMLSSKIDPNVNWDEDLFEKNGIKNVLLLLKPMSPGFYKILSQPKKKAVAIPGDVYNLKLTANVAKEIGIQGIICSPTALESFNEELEKQNFDKKSIKWISLGGEFCSNQRMHHFKELFPNSLISTRYFSSEFDLIGYQCEHLMQDDKAQLFHPAPSVLIEIEEQNSPAKTGKILCTKLEKTAMPMIRYSTKDVGSLETCECRCGNKFLLTLGGKENFDELKIHGATLYTQKIQDSLINLEKFFEKDFQLHVFEEKINNKIKPRLELHLMLKNCFKEKEFDSIFIEETRYSIAKNLRISSKKFLLDLEEDGIFMPLSLKFTRKKKSAYKSRRIVSHL